MQKETKTSTRTSCRVPKKMCRVPKKVCRVPKKCVIFGCTSKAPWLSLAKKLDELKDELKDELRERLGQVAKNEALLMEAFLNRYTLTPVSHCSSATLDGHWHQRAQEYYNTRSCLVLQNLFPDDFKVKPRWLHETGWDSIFPAVAAHIIPKNGYNFVQNELSIEIDSPRNSILLLRHLEHTFQDGDWSLIPAERSSGAVNFKIYVSQNLKEMNVNYIDENGDSSEAVRVRKGQARQALKPLKFGDLHERDLWVEPLPFLRALFLKARMAWQKHKEDDDPLPDPAQFADTFSDFYDTWNDFMVGKFLSSIRQLNSAGGTQSIKQTLKSSVAQELPKTTATITVLFEYQVSMIPCYQYPHINDTQNQVSTIR